MYKHLGTALVAALLSVAPASAATMVYNLSVADPNAGLGAGPFGTITVVENGGKLDITEQLLNGYFIHDGNANHNALAFNLNVSGATIGSLSSGFQVVSRSPVSEPPFGSFAYTIDCTSCDNGVNSTVKTLSFTLSASTALSIASLSPNTYQGTSIYFTSDLVSEKADATNGKTGNVGATASASAVPESATWAMFVLGFGSLGATMRRRKQVNVTFA